MIIVTVETEFDKDDVADAIAVLEAKRPEIEVMQGCLGFRHFGNTGSLLILQKWQSVDDFDTYRQSPSFAGLGAALKPLLTSPPVTTIGNVDTV